MNLLTIVIVVLAGSILGFLLSYLIARYMIAQKFGSRAFEPVFVNAQMSLQKHEFKKAVGLFEDVLSKIDTSNQFYIQTLTGLYIAYMGVKDYKNASEYLEKALSSAKGPIIHNQILKLKDEFDQLMRSDSNNTINAIKVL